MGSKYTKRYSEEFKGDAVALVDSSGKTVTAVAGEFGISSESLRGWYREAKTDRGEGTPGELTSAEREELKRLRKENREQQQTIEILKKGDRLLREGERPVSELYRFIHAEKANYPIVLLCRVLHVARSSCYARREARPPLAPGSPPTTRSRTRSRCRTSLPVAPTAFRASTPSCGVGGAG
ncbi:transposase [Streptomyces sp. NPDC018833]|uniref:transposase n=1 Tax=Streptomyces sp. NPDC018833 TaxID=3365053 RepID=UPI0037988D75